MKEVGKSIREVQPRFDLVRHGIEPQETLVEQMDLLAEKVAPLLE